MKCCHYRDDVICPQKTNCLFTFPMWTELNRQRNFRKRKTTYFWNSSL